MNGGPATDGGGSNYNDDIQSIVTYNENENVAIAMTNINAVMSDSNVNNNGNDDDDYIPLETPKFVGRSSVGGRNMFEV